VYRKTPPTPFHAKNTCWTDFFHFFVKILYLFTRWERPLSGTLLSPCLFSRWKEGPDYPNFRIRQSFSETQKNPAALSGGIVRQAQAHFYGTSMKVLLFQEKV